MQTNYGEEYNRESMYETAREQFLDCKKVFINGKCYDSLIGVMLEDCAMEQEKDEEYLKLAETYQQENNNEKVWDNFPKAWARGKVVDALLKRAEIAVEEQKDYLEFKNILYKAKVHKAHENLKSLSITQIENYLILLKEYESRLLKHMYGDTVTNLTYTAYKSVQYYIKELEQELSKRNNNKVM